MSLPTPLETDVLVAGGGLAGSLATAMLRRAGYAAVLVDPHQVYPPDLRCEKLDGEQVEILRRTGLADLVLPAATHDGEAWVARFGRVVDRRPGDQWGILYDTLVNTVRGTIPQGTTFVRGLVTGVTNSADRQIVTTSTGERFSARLVIVANGLNSGLRNDIGMPREDISKHHSITLAFDLKPVGRSAFDFGSLTYYAERPEDRVAYITLFPVRDVMRANLFVYREIGDAWLRDLRDAPLEAMHSVMPRLRGMLGPAEVVSPAKVRPADLYVTRNFLQPGIALVGDAFSTSCPAAGTGADKVLTDVERLCNVHVPRWLATPGMGVDKIGGFYADPVKVACDRRSFAEAFNHRATTIDPRLQWQAQRWGRFALRLAIGTGRGMLARGASFTRRQAQ
jgi:2-polyprenyl-6-methoxyphenol hydroxylase-like FAD-dependent oxidoreductase